MSFSSWLRSYKSALSRTQIANPARRGAKRSRRRQLDLEVLEARCLPSTFTVLNTNDNGGVNPAFGAGTGTLRQAIIDANATPNVGAADQIVFAMSASDPNHLYYRND